jgi:tRNA threonylcarbamoyladenosine biosynthesis protein TsaB
MKILALDASALTSTVAVLEDEKLLSLYTANSGHTHSETLLPMIKSMLETLKLTIDDIDAFALSNGPGSFTGVRIGAATIKGLAFDKNKICVEVSTIEALYENMEGFSGLVCPVMNARRDQVYTGAFLNGERVLNDSCMQADDLIEFIKKYDVPVYFVGDGYDILEKRNVKNFVPTPEMLRYQNAYSIGKASYKKIKKGETTTDANIKIEYLRKPQAEREREERLKGVTNE